MPGETPRDQMRENASQMVKKAQQEVEQQREPPYKVARKTAILMSVYLFLLLLFMMLALFVASHPVIALDVAITREFQENRAPWLKTLMIATSAPGNQRFFFALFILLTAICFWLVRLHLEAIIMISLSVLSSLINYTIKLLVDRPRPRAPLIEIFQIAGGKSFPSGHVMSYIAYFGLLFSFGLILFKRDHWWTYVVLLIPAFFVVMIGPSRIYLGDHWASDVLGAYIFGSILLGVTLWIYLVLKRRGILSSRTEMVPDNRSTMAK